MLLFFSCKNKKLAMAKEPAVYYTCSMHPQVHETMPGKCPICKMDLIAVNKNGKATDEIELSDQLIQLGNIQVDTIRNDSSGEQVGLAATLNFDQQKENVISARVMGRIDKLFFRNTGDYVHKGARIIDLYSEELNNAKQEYVAELEKQQTLDNSIVDFKQLVEAAKNKLLLWGMSESQIQELEKSKKTTSLTTIYSKASGYITSLDIKEGDYVQEGESLMKLSDLSTIWVEAQVYASQLAMVDKGSLANVQFPDLGGKEINGTIEFINPEINPDTRINLIRVSIPNPGNHLKPGMQAYVVIKNHFNKSMSLPSDAVLRDSKAASVWVQTSRHSFKNRMIETGPESSGRIQIVSGLRDGDIVVISGAYLLNSEYIFKKGANPMDGMKM
jgi:Cu(I)/Ag(I) efflux system membrane fusion protein